MNDDDIQVSDSGGTMVAMTGSPRVANLDLSCLEPLRRDPATPTRATGTAPFLSPGEVVTYSYGHFVGLLRVVRDDARGLVAWLPADSEQLVAVPRDGGGLRDRPLEERMRVLAEQDFDRVVQPWRGSGILRVVPTGAFWSVWYFVTDEGYFDGHYVNLELPHRRLADGAPATYSRDLILDLWLDTDGVLWLKDGDELEAAARGGYYTREQANAVHELAQRARRELVEPRAWPLDEGWETWKPPPGWDGPLTFSEHGMMQ